ncbi:MAG: rhamnulokinase family protein [Aggregatilineales bacterium]
MTTAYIAIDLGAESGRVMVGALDEGHLRLHEVHRFTNGPVRVRGGLFWDVLRLYSEIKTGLRAAQDRFGASIASLGIDTWGVDFGLLDAAGDLIGNPYCYRDQRTEGMMEAVFERVSRWSIFEQTSGIQFLPFNTLYQLYAMAQRSAPALQSAHTLLLMPDLLTYWLTGRAVCEFTNATTTQFYDSRGGGWARCLLAQLELPQHFLPEVVPPGTPIGPLLPEVCEETGLRETTVIAVCTHDTASAIAGVPAQSADFAWVSSGTWSLMGGVADRAIVTEEALRYNISSFGGPGGALYPWKNITGLWLVQACRRAWEQGGRPLSYDALTQLAAEAPPFVAQIDPDHPSFFAPPDMPAAIAAYCERTSQPIPANYGQMIRTILEGLALKYRWVLEKLELLVGHRYDRLHIVGGGSQNWLLNQLTADCIGRPVIAGPVEATAIGNIVVQAVAAGHLPDLAAARAVIGRSFETKRFEPRADAAWEAQYSAFLQRVAGQWSH